MRQGGVKTLARDIRADVIMERYYNFGGEGVLAASSLDVPAVLEVNAPVIDFPGSNKARLDRALVIEPMRRWRDRICRLTSLFVTPSADILPAWVDRQKVLEMEWGADVRGFRPDAPGTAPFGRDPRARAVRICRRLPVMAWRDPSGGGAGAAACRPATTASAACSSAMAPSATPLNAWPATSPRCSSPARSATIGCRPALAHAHIGVAPFDPSKHAPLRLGFYWSPLKIFEYMAVGLPVVAPALPRLARLIEHGREGLLYSTEDARGLDRAIQDLADPELRKKMGAAARARVVRDFSWEAHCRALGARLQALGVS